MHEPAEGTAEQEQHDTERNEASKKRAYHKFD